VDIIQYSKKCPFLFSEWINNGEMSQNDKYKTKNKAIPENIKFQLILFVGFDSWCKKKNGRKFKLKASTKKN
jgi:hypothetical protein